jgi:CSLREA domain-containing protein
MGLRRRLAVVAAFASVLAFVLPSRIPSFGATHATITVDETNDELNSDGDCSLREAVEAANTNSAVDDCVAGNGTDTITFASGTNNNDIDLTLGSVDLTSAMTIDGNGQGTTTVTGDEFFVDAVTATIKDMTLLDVNNEGGTATVDNVEATDEMNNNSGGSETTVMTITDSTLSDVTNNSGFGTAHTEMTISDSTVGFVDNNSGFDTSSTELTITNSTVGGVDNNAADGSTTTASIVDSTFEDEGITNNDGGTTVTISGTTLVGVNGEAVEVTGGATVTIVNSTITDNDDSGLVVDGTVAVINSTIFENASIGIDAPDPGVTIVNTIVAGNSDGDCVGSDDGSGSGVVSLGGNIDGDGTCNLIEASDQPNTDPDLGPLADNGGPTETHLPNTGSPAIDLGLDDPCPGVDQRGAARPQDGDGNGTATCDVGAVEVGSIEATGADLSITKSDSPDPVLVGGLLTTTLTVDNDGPEDAVAVVVTDSLPSEVSFDSASSSQGSCTESSGTVTCDLGDLAAGDSATVTITATADAEGTVTNSASVASSTEDPDQSDNDDSEGTTVNPIPGGGIETGAGGTAHRAGSGWISVALAGLSMAMAAVMMRRRATRQSGSTR